MEAATAITLIFLFVFLIYFGPNILVFGALKRSLRYPGRVLSDATCALMFWAIIFTPTLLLMLASAAIGPSWKGKTGPFGWFYMINAAEAGMVTWIVWVIACGWVSICLMVNRLMYTSRINFVMIVTLAAICLWRAGTAAVMGIEQPVGPNLSSFIFSCFPLAPGVNLMLLAIHIRTRRRFTGSVRPLAIFAPCWLGALAATIYAKIFLAQKAYNALSDVPDDKCFIVTAAARGNRRFVGSEFNPASGRMENSQLARMRAFERYLIAEFPAGHRLLRKIYNRTGPVIARRIRRPLIADAAYIILKPLELLAVVVCGRKPKR